MALSHESEAFRQRLESFDPDDLSYLEQSFSGGSIPADVDPTIPVSVLRGEKLPETVAENREQVEALVGHFGLFDAQAMLDLRKSGLAAAIKLAEQDQSGHIQPAWKVRLVDKEALVPVVNETALDHLALSPHHQERFILGPRHDYYRDIEIRQTP